jgi:hypothetical protein
MNHKALAIAPVVAIAALVLTAVEFAISQQAFAWGHRVVYHNSYHPYPVPVPYPVPYPVLFPDNRIFISQQVDQDNNCTKAICTNEAENQANTFGFVR